MAFKLPQELLRALEAEFTASSTSLSSASVISAMVSPLEGFSKDSFFSEWQSFHLPFTNILSVGYHKC